MLPTSHQIMTFFFSTILFLVVVWGSPCRAAIFPDADFVTIDSGTYTVGEEGHPTNPLRTVVLKPYRILSHEVTNREFALFIRATGYVTEAEKSKGGEVSFEGMVDWEWRVEPTAYWRYPHGAAGPCADTMPDYPVTQITYDDALAFWGWADVRLPTLEEWEVAARAGSPARYPWGEEFSPDGKQPANVWQGKRHEKNDLADGYLYAAPVKSFPPNRWGLYDVIGNVFEYCRGEILPDAAEREFACARGGSWWCSAGACHFFNLVDIGTASRHASLSNQGFRVVEGSEK